jgi:hypothetical protein
MSSSTKDDRRKSNMVITKELHRHHKEGGACSMKAR